MSEECQIKSWLSRSDLICIESITLTDLTSRPDSENWEDPSDFYLKMQVQLFLDWDSDSIASSLYANSISWCEIIRSMFHSSGTVLYLREIFWETMGSLSLLQSIAEARILPTIHASDPTYLPKILLFFWDTNTILIYDSLASNNVIKWYC